MPYLPDGQRVVGVLENRVPALPFVYFVRHCLGLPPLLKKGRPTAPFVECGVALPTATEGTWRRSPETKAGSRVLSAQRLIKKSVVHLPIHGIIFVKM
jgi:hypothetical protein